MGRGNILPSILMHFCWSGTNMELLLITSERNGLLNIRIILMEYTWTIYIAFSIPLEGSTASMIWNNVLNTGLTYTRMSFNCCFTHKDFLHIQNWIPTIPVTIFFLSNKFSFWFNLSWRIQGINYLNFMSKQILRNA